MMCEDWKDKKERKALLPLGERKAYDTSPLSPWVCLVDLALLQFPVLCLDHEAQIRFFGHCLSFPQQQLYVVRDYWMFFIGSEIIE